MWFDLYGVASDRDTQTETKRRKKRRADEMGELFDKLANYGNSGIYPKLFLQYR